jgi:hypothetical protein
MCTYTHPCSEDSGNLGSALSPIIVTAIVNYSGMWRTPFLVMSVLGIMSLAVL